MKRKTLGLLLMTTFVAMLLVPGAAAAITFAGQQSFDPDQRQVLLQQTFTGVDANELRRSIDTNGDATVSVAEVERWESERTLAEGGSCMDRPFNFTRVNEDPISWAEPYTYAKLSGATGGTTSAAPVEVTVVMSMRSDEPLRDGDLVTVEMDRMGDLARVWDCLFAAPMPLDLSLRPTYFFIGLGGAPLIEPVALMGAVSTGPEPGLQLDDPDEIAMAYQHQIRFRYVDGEGFLAGLQDHLGTLGLTLGLAALLVALASVASETVRERGARLVAWGVVPLYSRIKREKALDHERRERLYAHIRDHQGATFSDLRRALDLGSGSLSHHLRVLEGQGFVKVYRDGLRDRFYLHGPKVTPDEYLTRTQRALLEAIMANPGIHQKRLAARLGLTRQSVRYHEKVLAEKGVVRAEAVGRVRRYFPVEGANGVL